MFRVEYYFSTYNLTYYRRLPHVVFPIFLMSTWTILKTTPNGFTCIMAVGDGWHEDTGELTPVGDPI